MCAEMSLSRRTNDAVCIFLYEDQGRIQMGFLGVCNPPEYPENSTFLKNFPEGVPPDPPITGLSTCNPPFVLVWIRP